MNTMQTSTLTGRHLLQGLLASLATALVLNTGAVWANSIAVTNTALQDAPVSGQSFIQFDVSWSNSWRATWTEAAGDNVTGADPLSVENWDAAWVFAKYRTPDATGWKHATLSDASGDHQKPSGAALDIGLTSGNGVGVFVYRDAVGNGPINFENVRLRWLHDQDGVSDTGTVDIAVHAIEMVYVQGGAFHAGSPGGIGTGDYTNWFHAVGNPDAAYLVDSEDAQTIYWATGLSASLPAEFPKGYNAFYCMKYPVTQGQYTDFLNSLSPDQVGPRFNGLLTGLNRYTIGMDGPVFTNGAPDRACNYLSWLDLAAYLAWSGLRPMSELEYEKACRGPRHAVAGEYAWGTITYTSLTSVTSEGTGMDIAVPTSANSFIGAKPYPLRAGIFARTDSGRELAGASYWGILEMSGVLIGRAVTVGNSTGLLFTGLHGNGTLNPAGEAAVDGWPAGPTMLGSGVRGYAGNPGGNLGMRAGMSRFAARGAAASTLVLSWGDAHGRSEVATGRGIRKAP